jgi:chromosome segregation ATPase
VRELRLDRLVITGFKSFKDKTLIDFPQTDGLRYLTGDNKLEPDLGANGTGKSAMWDALVWCLYGVTVKGRKASDAMTWGNKSMEVVCWFNEGGIAHGDNAFLITRTSPPNKIYVNGDAVDQGQVDRLMGMSKDCFLQSVVFGQGVNTFYDLNTTGRGELLDEVMDLGLWLRASQAAGKRVSAMQDRITTAQRTLAAVEGSLASLEPEETFTVLVEQWDATREQQFESVLAVVQAAEVALANAVKQKDSAMVEYEGFLKGSAANRKRSEDLVETISKDIRDCDTKIGIVEGQLIGVNKDRITYSREGACPTCGNYLKPADRIAKFKAANAKAEALELEKRKWSATQRKHLNDREALTNLLTKVNGDITNLRSAVTLATAAITAAQGVLQRWMAQAEAMAAEDAVNPHTAALEANKAKRVELTKTKGDAADGLDGMMKYQEQAKYWVDAFKRVRLWLMKRVLGVLELETAAAAATLGLPGWTIAYSTEIELKNGNAKPGIHIQVSSPHTPGAWVDQSGGEEQRVRLAVAMGFGSVIQRQCGTLHALEVWDEPSSYLSTVGVEDLIDCLAYRAQAAHKTCWITDHGAMASGAYVEAWSVVKDASGARVEVLQTEG